MSDLVEYAMFALMGTALVAAIAVQVMSIVYSRRTVRYSQAAMRDFERARESWAEVARIRRQREERP